MAPASPPDYFAVLEAPRRFAQDRAALERRFYELSRKFHPDRFTLASPAERQSSLERMSLINEAYRVLRDPAQLRDYVLQLHGLAATGEAKRGNVPVDLAEEWFEAQDDPGAAAIFADKIATRVLHAEAAISAYEAQLDQDGWSQAGLATLADLVQGLSFLKSMERDVARLKG